MQHVWGRTKVHIVLVGKSDGKSNMEDPSVAGRIIQGDPREPDIF